MPGPCAAVTTSQPSPALREPLGEPRLALAARRVQPPHGKPRTVVPPAPQRRQLLGRTPGELRHPEAGVEHPARHLAQEPVVGRVDRCPALEQVHRHAVAQDMDVRADHTVGEAAVRAYRLPHEPQTPSHTRTTGAVTVGRVYARPSREEPAMIKSRYAVVHLAGWKGRGEEQPNRSDHVERQRGSGGHSRHLCARIRGRTGGVRRRPVGRQRRRGGRPAVAARHPGAAAPAPTRGRSATLERAARTRSPTRRTGSRTRTP